jgi:glutamyl-tRNA synthetase
MEYEAVAEALRALGIDEGPQFWEAIRGNVASLGEARQWHEIIRGRISIDLKPEDKQLLSEAKTLLPPEPWDRSSWTAWTNASKRDRAHRQGVVQPAAARTHRA